MRDALFNGSSPYVERGRPDWAAMAGTTELSLDEDILEKLRGPF